ncbi:MAG: DUF3782 domain-containing protein [Prochlorothrix sp.]|nr:DUF3782 domain-containing protein [Prochlorothrix sp.]
MASTPEEVWQLLGELVQSQKETDRKIQALTQSAEQRNREAEQRNREAEQRSREVDRQLKELGKQIGGLGAKFGSFTEGMAYPSMSRILQEQFGMECVGPRVRRKKNGQEMEIDVLAYANGDRQAVYVVEVKSHPREESVEQMRRLLQRFPEFFPEHSDKELYGILAAVDLSETVREKVLAEGLYVARIEDEVFALDVPEGFQARSWS